MIYTAIAGDYPIARTDIKCFTGDGIFPNPIMEAKRYKVLPHLFLPDEPITMWVDGNIFSLKSFEEICGEFLGGADMALFYHSYRSTIWQEFAALYEQKRFQIPWLQEQLRAQESEYRLSEFPGEDLYECNFMIRRNTKWVNRAMDAWWSQICRWQWRDQVSLPYVLWKYPINVRAHAFNIRDHPSFRYVSQY